MNRDPDFYLASSEWKRLTTPRRAWVLARVAWTGPQEMLLVKIDPPIVGQPFGMGGEDLDNVLLAPRHRGERLTEPATWPVSVFIVRPLDDPLVGAVGPERVENLAWGEIYPFRNEPPVTLDESH